MLVDFAGEKQPKLAGLYAEGRVEAASTTGLTVPATALVRDGDKATAWRLTDNTLQAVSLVLGERDPRSGDYVLRSGLADGDKLIRHPGSTLKAGQKVEMAAVPTASPPAATIAPVASAEKGK